MSVAMAGRPFPLQHQQHHLISFPAAQQASSSRSGSITSTNSLRPLTTSDYMDLATAQHNYQQQHSGITHSDSGSYLR